MEKTLEINIIKLIYEYELQTMQSVNSITIKRGDAIEWGNVVKDSLLGISVNATPKIIIR
jgi:hypothetical protein